MGNYRAEIILVQIMLPFNSFLIRSVSLNCSILLMVMKGGGKGYEEEYFWSSWYF